MQTEDDPIDSPCATCIDAFNRLRQQRREELFLLVLLAVLAAGSTSLAALVVLTEAVPWLMTRIP